MGDLKKKTISGFVYKFAERAGAQGVRFLVQLLLARLLLPEDYGVVALVDIFIAICDVFVRSSFGSALIANKKSDSADFSTCFYFNVSISILLYALVFFAAPWIASFYSSPVLIPLVRVMGLRIPIAAVNSVQHAYVSKNMWFRKFFQATLVGTVVSGAIAVIMAYSGFGIWALAEQYLGNALIDTVCLWFMVGWRPTREFSWTKLKAIFDYGWKILATALLDTVYSRLRSLIIGKCYSPRELAHYTRGYTFPSFGMRLIEPTVIAVLFPALAQCSDNQAQMRSITRRVLRVSTYLISPVMVGMAIVATPLVRFVLTDKWMPCIIFIQIGCTANLFRCQQFINVSVIKASGRSDILLKLDVLKKAIGLALLFAAVPFGVVAIAFSKAVFYFISVVINVAPNRTILAYGYRDQFRDVAGNILPALLMGLCIYPVGLTGWPPWLLLATQIPLGAVVYLAISAALRNESFFFVLNHFRRWIHRSGKTQGGSS